MKKIVYFLTVALAATSLFSSCGSKAPAAPASKSSAVIEYAMQDPDRRAFGQGTHFQADAARRTAEANARAALAAAIQTMVQQSFDSFAGSVAATGSVDGIDSMLSEDQVATMNQAVTAISKECVTNTAAVKMDFETVGNQTTFYVCIEHRLGVAELVKQVSEKLSNNIPDEIKEQIKYDQFLHEKKMQEAFEEYKAIAE